MAPYNYSARINEHRARAVGLLLPISTKQSVEICKFIRGKKVQKAINMLSEVIDMKKPVPFNQFANGAGHKHGIGPGKYPVKACNEILKLVKLVESNAQHKGLNTSGLEIVHICAKKGPKSWHYGRQSRIAMKRTHVEIVVEEKETKKKEVKKEPAKKKELKKQEEKPKETKKPIEKVEKKQVKEEKPIVKKVETKKEQSKEIKKPAEEKKEKTKEKTPAAAELAEKTKEKENKADKK
jgi:large subunit ribosomal protein L22